MPVLCGALAPFDAAALRLHAVTAGVGAFPNTLVTVSPGTGQQTLAGTPGAATQASGAIDFDPLTGALHGVDGSATPGLLRRIDVVTGASSDVGTVRDVQGLPVTMDSLCFDSDGSLFVGTAASIGRVDRSTFTFMPLLPHPAGHSLVGIDIAPAGVLYAVYHRVGDSSYHLASIDPHSMAATRQIAVQQLLAVGDIDVAPDGYIYHANFGLGLGRIDPLSGAQTIVGAGQSVLDNVASYLSVDATELFDWAERAYAVHFPSHQTSRSSPPYVYRYYPETGNYLGVSGSTVAVLGPISGGSLLVVGDVADFGCRVLPAACGAPVVLTQPASQLVAPPAPATFQVATRGSPSPTHRWQISTDGLTFADIDGASSKSYTLSPTTTADDGKWFRVIVTNGAGSVASAAASLGVRTAASDPVFASITAKMGVGRVLHTATRLQDGSVLLTGGFGSTRFPGTALASAERYNPVTRTFSAVASPMRSARVQHTATLLSDGQVLLAGGQADTNDGDGVATAELYDPRTQTFSALIATMKSPRGGHAAVRLADGKVLITGGFYKQAGTLTVDAEIYDSATRTFTALGARMAVLRNSHRSTLLPDGKVLVTGGYDERKAFVGTAELFDPATGRFTAIPAALASVRGIHEATALPSGQVLVTGGASVLSPTNVAALGTAEVFDPVIQFFGPIASAMTVPRAGHAAALLSDGSVLLTGGLSARTADGSFIVLDSAELFKGPTGSTALGVTHPLNDTGVPSSACYAAGSHVPVACTSAAALALNDRQDGMLGRDVADASPGDGRLGFSYSAIAGGCVKDNVTGLTWEVKGASGSGLRDMNHVYTNHNNSTAGDASALVAAVNAAGLCGYTDWRVPTVDELLNLVDYSVAYPGPTLDAAWFPNTAAAIYSYWASTPGNGGSAWIVDFRYGTRSYVQRHNVHHVRLVR